MFPIEVCICSWDYVSFHSFHHQTLRWASGFPKYTSSRRPFLLTRLPPLPCILDYQSARFAVRLLFPAADRPVRQYMHFPGRTVQQLGLSAMGRPQDIAHYHALMHSRNLCPSSLGSSEPETCWRTRKTWDQTLTPLPGNHSEGGRNGTGRERPAGRQSVVRHKHLEHPPPETALPHKDGPKLGNQ